MLKILQREWYEMKKLLSIPVIFLALFFLYPISYVKAEQDDSEYKINNEFKNSKLKIKENTFILEYKYEDITGDNVKDNIILVGMKKNNPQDLYSDKIRLVIQDGNNKKFYKVLLGKIDYGYKSNLFIGDFDGDRVSDVLIGLSNDEKGESCSYSLLSFKNNKKHYMFKQDNFSKGLSFEVDFVDGFKANILNKHLNKYYLADLSNKRDTYINSRTYDNNGELVQDRKGSCSGLIELRPQDLDSDGTFELKGIQRFTGISQEDTIGYAKSIWKYEGSKFVLISLDVIPFAKPGNNQRIQRIIPVFNEIN